jgi:hypothetical protein
VTLPKDTAFDWLSIALVDKVSVDLWRKECRVAKRSGRLYETPYGATLLIPCGPLD